MEQNTENKSEQIRNAVWDKLVSSLDSMTKEDLTRLALEILKREQENVVLKLLGLHPDQKFESNQNRNSGFTVFQEAVKTELEKHTDEFVNDLKRDHFPAAFDRLRKEFVDYGILYQQLRTELHDRLESEKEQFIEEAVKQIKANILKDVYHQTHSEPVSPAKE